MLHNLRVETGRDGQFVSFHRPSEDSGANAMAQNYQQAISAGWRSVGIEASGSKFTALTPMTRGDAEALTRVVRGDGKPGDLSHTADVLGRVAYGAQMHALRPLGDVLEQTIAMRGDARTIVSRIADGLGQRADAVLGSPGAVGEILTLWAMKRYSRPSPITHFRQFFGIDATLNPAMMQVNLLFFAASGQATFSDGRSAAVDLSDPGVEPMTRPIHILMSSYDEAWIDVQRQAAMGMPADLDVARRHELAHELAHNQIAFSGRGIPDVAGLANYPGIRVMSSGLLLSTATDDQLAALLNQALHRPGIDSNQQYKVNRIVIDMEMDERITRTQSLAPGKKSVKASFLEANPGVTIEVMHEMNDLIGSGLHAVVGLPDNADVAPTYLMSPRVILPQAQMGAYVRTHSLSATAGIVSMAPIAINIYTVGD